MKKIIFFATIFGLFLTVVFGAMLGGSFNSFGGRIIAGLYNILIFPLHFWGYLFGVITGKPVGQVSYGFLFILLSLPITYGLLAWGIYSIFYKSKKQQK